MDSRHEQKRSMLELLSELLQKKIREGRLYGPFTTLLDQHAVAVIVTDDGNIAAFIINESLDHAACAAIHKHNEPSTGVTIGHADVINSFPAVCEGKVDYEVCLLASNGQFAVALKADGQIVALSSYYGNHALQPVAV